MGDYEQSGHLGLLNRATIRFAKPRAEGPPEILSFVDQQRNRITTGPRVASISLVTEALAEGRAPSTVVRITEFNSGPDQKNGLVPNHGLFISEGMSTPLKFVYKPKQWAASDVPVPGTLMRASTLAKLVGDKYYIEFYRLRADPKDLDKLRNFVVPPHLAQSLLPLITDITLLIGDFDVLFVDHLRATGAHVFVYDHKQLKNLGANAEDLKGYYSLDTIISALRTTQQQIEAEFRRAHTQLSSDEVNRLIIDSHPIVHKACEANSFFRKLGSPSPSEQQLTVLVNPLNFLGGELVIPPMTL